MSSSLTAHRIAVLSDIHGVDPALDVVLSEPDVVSADLIVVTGDLAAGPQPRQVLDRLRSLGERVLLVRGNADRELVGLATGELADEDVLPIDAWAAAQLEPDDLDLLSALPHPLTVELAGIGSVLFAHGSPRDDDEVVLVDTRPSRWQEVLAQVPPQVRIVCLGHTHMPFARLVDRRWVVNSGSIGMPYGSAGLPWTLLDADGVHLRSTPVDPLQLAAEVLGNSTFPGRRDWVEEYIVRPPGDLDALTTFGPRDGRTPGWDD